MKHEKISSHHLKRNAILDVRQSSAYRRWHTPALSPPPCATPPPLSSCIT